MDLRARHPDAVDTDAGSLHGRALTLVSAGRFAEARALLTTALRLADDLDVRADVQRRYNAAIQQRLTKTTWMSGCSSWYLTADGFNASMYPGLATQYLRQMRQFRFDDYAAVAHGAHMRAVSSTA